MTSLLPCAESREFPSTVSGDTRSATQRYRAKRATTKHTPADKGSHVFASRR